MKEQLDRLIPIFPWAGLLLLLAGGIVYLITRRFDLTTNLLFAGGAILLLLFAILRPDDLRQLASRRQARYGASTTLSILFFAAIMGLLYWIAFQNPGWRWDVTETGEFTPTAEIVDLLNQLDEPVHVIAFYPPAMFGQEQQARTMLDGFAAVTDQLTYEFVDPEINPLRAQEYDLNFPGTLVFTKGDNFSRSNILNDREIYIALLQVIHPIEKKAYFLTGHGERAIDDFGPEGLDTAVRFIEDQGFTVEPLNLFLTGAIPDDATLVAMVDPQTPLEAEEVSIIRQYLREGGALFLARDIVADDPGRLRAEADGLADMLLEDWGVRLRNDLIIDQDLAMAGQSFGWTFIGADYGPSSIATQELRRFGTRFELARSIETQPVEGVVHTNLVLTSDQAWGETDFETLVTAGFAEPNPETDALGPLAVAVSARNQETEARLVVVGDVSFLTNQGFFVGGNSILFSNALNWLADDEVTIELAPRPTVERQVLIPQTQMMALQLASICLGPLFMLLLGGVVWYSRRQRE